MKILNIYKWATMGGVERVLLNRAQAFKKHHFNIRQDALFLYDAGGLQNFRSYIKLLGLEGYINVVSKVEEKLYDLIFTFDTPEVFGYVKDNSKVIVECHSPYKESRAYLAKLSKNVRAVALPSDPFRKLVINEIPEHFVEKLFILPNFYVRHGDVDVKAPEIWAKRPICYIGRMDSLKNTKELLGILKKLDESFFLLLVGNVDANYMNLTNFLKEHKLENRVSYFRPVPFERVDLLLEAIRRHKGVFVSSSRGESFGLSALEAMANGVPALLSDIECHRALVDDKKELLYGLGNITEAAKKIEHICKNKNYNNFNVKQLASRFDSESFIEAWTKYVER